MAHLLDGPIGVRPRGLSLQHKKQRPTQQDGEKTRDGRPQPHGALIVTPSSAALPAKRVRWRAEAGLEAALVPVQHTFGP